MKARLSVSAAIALVSALLLGVAGVAEAVNLFTAPLQIFGEPVDAVVCQLVNPTDDAVLVTIEVFNSGGVSVAGPVAFALGAGLVAAVEHFPTDRDRFYCKFTSNNNSVRVAINRFNLTIGDQSDQNGYGDNR